LEEVILDIPPDYSGKSVYATFGMRALAMVLDFVIETVAFIVAMAYFGENIHDVTLIIVGIAFTDMLYNLLMESSVLQGTVGKLIVGIKVATKMGSRITLVAAAGRYFGKVLSWPLFGIGHLAAAWDPQHQALHDKIGNTYVLKR
jgi:uncharacterized RDD family membrane protein YckC